MKRARCFAYTSLLCPNVIRGLPTSESDTYVRSDSIQSTGSDHSHNGPEYHCKFTYLDKFGRVRTYRENSNWILSKSSATNVNRDIYVYLEMPQECGERRCRM